MVCSITLGCWNCMSESQRNPTVPSLQYLYAYVSMHQVNTVYSPFFQPLCLFLVSLKSHTGSLVEHLHICCFCGSHANHHILCCYFPAWATVTTATDTPILLFRLTAGRPSTLCDVIQSSELQPQMIMERTINSWV